MPPTLLRAAAPPPPPPPPPRSPRIAPGLPPAPAVADRPALPPPGPRAPLAPLAPPPPTVEKPTIPAPTVATRTTDRPKAPVAKPAAPTTEEPKAPVARPPAPTKPERKTAALPPAKGVAEPATGAMLRFEFSGDSAALPNDATGQLEALAERLLRSDSLRVQVKAYAGGSADSVSAARRLSLSRALAVRAFLMDQGVRSTRIDVRALGNRSEGGPPERVDIVVVKS